MGTLPPELLAAIQAKAQGGPPAPGNMGTSEPLNEMDGAKPKPKKPVKKKTKKKLTPAEKKAALERRMNKSGSSKPNPFASK